MLQTLKDFGTRNVVISNGENIGGFLSPIDFFRGTINAILTRQDVEEGNYYQLSRNYAIIKHTEKYKRDVELCMPYSVVSEKSLHLQALKQEILSKIVAKGALDTSEIQQTNYLLNTEILKNKDIMNACLAYFQGEFLRIKDFLNTPKIYGNNKIKLERYPDLDHSLLENEKKMLAFLIHTCQISLPELENISQILEKYGDSLRYFLEEYYTPSYFKDFLENLLNPKKESLGDILKQNIGKNHGDNCHCC